MRRSALTASAAVAALAIAGCGGSDSKGGAGAKPESAKPASGAAAATAKIPITDFKFVPKAVTVKTGAKVTWTNNDTAPHTAQTDSGAFDTGTLKKGQSKTVTLAKAGTYEYYCAFHRFMTGTIIVR